MHGFSFSLYIAFTKKNVCVNKMSKFADCMERQEKGHWHFPFLNNGNSGGKAVWGTEFKEVGALLVFISTLFMFTLIWWNAGSIISCLRLKGMKGVTKGGKRRSSSESTFSFGGKRKKVELTLAHSRFFPWVNEGTCWHVLMYFVIFLMLLFATISLFKDNELHDCVAEALSSGEM